MDKKLWHRHITITQIVTDWTGEQFIDNNTCDIVTLWQMYQWTMTATFLLWYWQPTDCQELLIYWIVVRSLISSNNVWICLFKIQKKKIWRGQNWLHFQAPFVTHFATTQKQPQKLSDLQFDLTCSVSKTDDWSAIKKPAATIVQQPTPAVAPLADSKNRFWATGGKLRCEKLFVPL